jgi:hypothetical protein
MGCNCKKRVEKVIEYDNKLSGKKSKTVIIEEKGDTNTSDFIIKIFNPLIGLLKGLGIVIGVSIVICIVIVFTTIWLIWHMISRFIFKKDSKLNSPFYEYDKIKKRIKEHNEKVRNLVKSKKEKDVNTTIEIKQ